MRRQALSRFGASFLLPDSRPERCDGHDQYAVIAAIGLPTSAGKEHHEFGVSDLSHGIAADFVAEGFELIRIVIVHLKVTEFYFDGTPPDVRQLDNDINFNPLVIARIRNAIPGTRHSRQIYIQITNAQRFKQIAERLCIAHQSIRRGT